MRFAGLVILSIEFGKAKKLELINDFAIKDRKKFTTFPQQYLS